MLIKLFNVFFSAHKYHSLFSCKESCYFVNKDYFFLEKESKIYTRRVIGTGKAQANRKRI